MPGAAIDGVITGAGIDVVVVLIAIEEIVAAAGVDGVGAVAAGDGVSAITCGDGIIAVAAGDGVVAGAAIDGVIAITAIDGVVAGIGKGDSGRPTPAVVGSGGGCCEASIVDIEAVVGTKDVKDAVVAVEFNVEIREGVIAIAKDHIIASTGCDGVVAGATGDVVIEIVADDDVITGA
mgnify:CR=1 FL=1